MSSNICGNCQNFKPKKGDKFLNCTNARHAGIEYVMQVRADTKACDAFLPYGTPPKPTPSTGPTLQPKPKPEPEPKPSVLTKPARKPEPKLASTAKPKTAAKPKPAPKLPQEPSAEDRPRPTGLCIWGRVILTTALLLVIGLPAWGIYSCVSKPTTSVPISTPVPMPANAIVQDFAIGDNIWATGSGREVMVSSADKKSSYTLSKGEIFNAPSGKVFIFITVTCKNIGNTSFLTGPSYFLLTDSAGYPYQDQTYGDNRFSKPYPNASLSPSVTIAGNILWVVPASASGMEVSYLLDSGSNPPVIARWKLPQ